MTELIRVDFKKRFVKSRQELGAQEAYSPFKDEEFKQYTASLGELAIAAKEKGIDVKRMITIIDDPDSGTALMVYDQDVLTQQDAMNALAKASLRIEANLQGPGTA